MRRPGARPLPAAGGDRASATSRDKVTGRSARRPEGPVPVARTTAGSSSGSSRRSGRTRRRARRPRCRGTRRTAARARRPTSTSGRAKEVREVVKSPPQLRRRRHATWEQSAAYYHRHTTTRSTAFVKNAGPRLRDPVPAQRPGARLRPRLPRPAQDRPADPPDPGDQGLRPAGRREAGRCRALGRGGQRRRVVRPLAVRSCEEGG